MRLLIISLVLTLLTISACNRTQKESVVEKAPDTEKHVTKKATKTAVKKATTENFNSFYKRFHTDSIFQISRVKFPVIKGENPETEKKNWMMHRATVSSIDTSMFKTKITKTGNYYKEVIYIDGGGFYLEREFKRINGKWYLTSFVDENY